MSTIHVKYKRNPHQREFHADTKTKFLHLSSGFGGGKSYALAMKAFQLARLNKGMPGGCVVPSIPEFKKDLLPIFEEILEANRIRYRYHQTDKWFRFPWSTGRLYVATAEKKIRGPNWAYMVGNEIGLIQHARYKEGIGRVRIKGAPNPQIATSGTPEGTGSWLHEKFVETPMKNSRVIYGDTRDNQENLNDDYIATLEDSYDPIMLDAYLRGLWVNMNGSRFYYAYDPKRNDNLAIEQIEDAPVYVSLDYNVAPMIATLWNVVYLSNKNGIPILDPITGKQKRKALAFDSIIIEDGAETRHMAKALLSYGLDPETTYIYPDPAGKSRSTKGPPDNEILKEYGFRNIRSRLAAPQFRKRQLGVCNLLSKGQIEIHPIRCKALKKDFEAVEQDRATFEKIKTNPKLTHASDGADYFFDIEFPLSGHKPDSRSTQIR